MIRRFSLAMTIALMVLAVPAFGATYTFELDDTQSTLSFASGTYVTGMSGWFSLELAGTSPAWAGNVELEGIDATSLDDVSIFGVYNILAGDMNLLDFDEDNDDSGTLAGGPTIATGTVDTELNVNVAIVGQSPLAGWQGPYEWTVEVSDDNFLGAANPGSPEATLHMDGEIVDGLVKIPFAIDLIGAVTPTVVPEPATVMMLLGGVLALVPIAWRRRRRNS